LSCRGRWLPAMPSLEDRPAALPLPLPSDRLLELPCRAACGPPSPCCASVPPEHSRAGCRSSNKLDWAPGVYSPELRAYPAAMTTVDHCPDCPYREFGPAVGTRGDPSSRIVLVGEAPGRQEITAQKPFVGAAGEILWKAVAAAGLKEADLFVVNSIACLPHPVHPRVSAINACRGRLVREIAAYRRGVIVTLGATAYRAVTDQHGVRVMDARLQPPTKMPWGSVVATLHPARVMRRRDEMPLLVEDLNAARQRAGM
jgi:uracil-DNA glycosylase family 4